MFINFKRSLGFFIDRNVKGLLVIAIIAIFIEVTFLLTKFSLLNYLTALPFHGQQLVGILFAAFLLIFKFYFLHFYKQFRINKFVLWIGISGIIIFVIPSIFSVYDFHVLSDGITSTEFKFRELLFFKLPRYSIAIATVILSIRLIKIKQEEQGYSYFKVLGFVQLIHVLFENFPNSWLFYIQMNSDIVNHNFWIWGRLQKLFLLTQYIVYGFVYYKEFRKVISQEYSTH